MPYEMFRDFVLVALVFLQWPLALAQAENSPAVFY